MAQKADVAGELHCALGNAGKDGEREIIRLARVGLPADGIHRVKAELFGDERFKAAHLVRVAVKKLQKACRSAGRAAAAQQLQARERKIKMVKIHDKILHPQRGALAHGGGLRRLKMGIGKGWLRLVLLGKVSERGNGAQKQAADAQKRVALQNNVGIIPDKAARSAEVDDRLRLRAGKPKGVDMRHDIMPDLPLACGGGLIIYII